MRSPIGKERVFGCNPFDSTGVLLKLWNAEKRDLFSKNLDITKVMEIEMKLDQLQENPSVIYDDVVSEIGTLFESASINTFGYKKSSKKTIDKYARNTYHKTRKMYNKYKSDYYKNLLKAVSKNYKQTLSMHKKQFQNQKVKRNLDDLRMLTQRSTGK